MAKMGRPTSYYSVVQPHLADIEAWAGQGLTRDEIAARLGTTSVSLWRYEKDHEDLCIALKRGDAAITANVEGALAKKALGGDVVAMIFFLKNKCPSKWRDKQDLRLSGAMTYREMVAAKKAGAGPEATDDSGT